MDLYQKILVTTIALIALVTACGAFEECENELDFMCRSDKTCIDSKKMCDKKHDCEDGSDEEDCGKICIYNNYWQCNEHNQAKNSFLRLGGKNSFL